MSREMCCNPYPPICSVESPTKFKNVIKAFKQLTPADIKRFPGLLLKTKTQFIHLYM